MSGTIWKYEILVEDEFHLAMPSDAEVLYVDIQNEKPYIWARLPTGDSHSGHIRKFYVRGTGHSVDSDLKYLGSFQLMEGRFVGHLFE